MLDLYVYVFGCGRVGGWVGVCTRALIVTLYCVPLDLHLNLLFGRHARMYKASHTQGHVLIPPCTLGAMAPLTACTLKPCPWSEQASCYIILHVP